jgi:ATP-binding cassette, subfamily B, bacterial
MHTALRLRRRRYTILDGLTISFRSAPVAAFFYGFFGLASAALIPLMTLAAARFIDEGIRSFERGAATRDLYQWLAILVALTAFQWLRRAMHNFADLSLVLGLRARYRTALTEKRTRLSYRHVEDAATWDLVQRIAAHPEGGRLKASYFHLVDIVAFVIKVAGLLAILAAAVWWAPLPVVVVSALALILGIRGGARLYQAERDVARRDRRCDYLGDVLLGRESAAERTLFGYTSQVVRMWSAAFDEAFTHRMRTRLRWYLNAYTGNVTNLMIWVFIMIVLLPPLQAGFVTVGLFIALSQAFTRFDIVWGFMDTVNGLSADAEFFKDLTAFMALEEVPSVSTAVRQTAPEFRSIELVDVRFRYPGSDRWVIDGLSLRLETGTHYALVGANGSGKTTLTRLLTGLYPPDSGSILINGREIGDYSTEELRSFYSIVYQDFARYGVSVRDNILLGMTADDGDRPPEDALVREVVEKVGLARVIAGLPNGLETTLGKHVADGVDISRGEWQRIAMARSLVRPAPVRILDEPAAALDPVAESELYARFDALTTGATTLLITHRLGAAKIADELFVLDAGRLAESGSHDALMRAGGLYRRMYEGQRYWYDA